MQRWNEFWRRLGGAITRGRMNRTLDEEIRFHLEARTEDLMAEGFPAKEARQRAQREFGGSLRILEDSRAAWCFSWLEDLVTDMRQAGRSFAKNPGFVGVAVLSLAIGTGANTAIFSLATSFLFNRPSVQDADTLVRLRVGGNSHISLREFRFLQELKPFEALAGVREEKSVNWQSSGETRRVPGFSVSDNYFDVVGVPIAMGRGLRPNETDTVVISDQFWRSQLGATADILGRTVVFDAQPYTVVGVLPDNHRTISGFGLAPNFYLASHKETDMVALIARVTEGSTREQTLGKLHVAAQELDRVYPREHSKWADNLRYYKVAGIESFGAIGPAEPLLMFFGLLGIVAGLVLLVSCANVSGLLLARTAARQQEVAVRLSLGAPRNRILRQWLAESLLLAGVGTIGGLAINRALIALVSRVELPLPFSVRIVAEADDRLALYACLVAAASALLVGAAPALHAVRRGVLSGLRQTERTATGRQYVRRVMVVGQLTVCAVLLATGFLFLRNLQESSAMNVGFDTDNTIWASVRVLDERYPTSVARNAFVTEALQQLGSIRGVESATVSSIVPLTDGETHRSPIRTAQSEEPLTPRYNFNRVGPEYFQTFAIPILNGREFNRFDQEGSPRVVIMNQSMAQHVFGSTNPVGQTIRFRDGVPVTVVGIASDSKYGSLGETDALALYEPWMQSTTQGQGSQFVVRAPGSKTEVAVAVRKLFQELDPSAAVEVKTMTDALALALLPSRGGAILLGGLGVLGVFLAAVGLGGMIAYSVQGRTKEIGLRMALGATPARVFGLVAREAAWMTGIGLALGLGIAVFAAQPLAMFLVPGLATTDPAAFGAVVLVLVLVAFAATLGPAQRALGVEPLNALRND